MTIVGVQNAPAPRLPRIEGLAIRGIGQTMSMQIVGGEISSEVTHNFLIEPTRVGRFTIPSLSVEADGRSLETEPLTREAASVLVGAPNLILTPHIAGVTQESNVRVSELIARRVREALQASPG